MQPPPAHPVYEFGDFELDTQRRILVARADGQPVDITGRVFEALVFLVERPGQLIAKKELIEALWPHVVVEEGNLTQTIHSLRRVLGERAGEHRYIATVPGRGYRFVAEVRVRTAEVPAPAQVVPARRPRWVLAAAAAAAVLVVTAGVLAWIGRDQPAQAPTAPVPAAAQTSIAVLPFVDMSEAQDQEHFADGLSEEILNLLARANELRVIARTSSFSFKDQNVDIGTIAQRLTVSHVLEGSVRKSGDRVRITAQLIDAATSAHIWSDTFDRDVQDIFGVQREIAAAVTDALHVTLSPGGATRAETSSAEAYDHLLQGRHLFHRRSGNDILQAKAHFEKAVQIDPAYARAWAALAGVYLVALYEHVDVPDLMQNWKVATERAVELAPDLAEAHIRAAQYESHVGNVPAAYAHFDRAVELDPDDPLVLGMRQSKAMNDGLVEEALEMQRRVVAADPLSATNRANFGALLMHMGRLSEARTEVERALELSPARPSMVENVADVLILQGEIDEALKVISRLPDGYSRDQRLALAYLARGSVSEGDAMLARLITRAETPDSEEGLSVSVAIAEVYVAKKDPDRAFDWLEKARLRSLDQVGYLPGWLIHENLQIGPHLKPLHADPRWDEYIAKLKK